MKYLVIIAVTGLVMMGVVGCAQGAANHALQLDGSDYFTRNVGGASDDCRADHLLRGRRGLQCSEYA